MSRINYQFRTSWSLYVFRFHAGPCWIYEEQYLLEKISAGWRRFWDIRPEWLNIFKVQFLTDWFWELFYLKHFGNGGTQSISTNICDSKLRFNIDSKTWYICFRIDLSFRSKLLHCCFWFDIWPQWKELLQARLIFVSTCQVKVQAIERQFCF